MKNQPPANDEHLRDAEDQRARTLEQVHRQVLESVAQSTPRPSPQDATPVGDEVEAAERLLQMIERVRRGNIPPNAGETPGQFRSSASDTSASFFSSATDVAKGVEPGDEDSAASSGDGANIPRRLGRFEIERVLGKGGFGVVFAASDPQLKRRVALKVPRPDALASDEGQARFLREAKTAALLGHPNIVTVYEAGRAGPVLYIAYELVDGISLSHWLETHRLALSYTATAKIMSRLASAVQHAHSRNVIHRDLKPGNILLQWGTRGDDPTAGVKPVHDAKELEMITTDQFADRMKISDFGMAHLGDEDLKLTRTGSIVGTPAYLAPEQIRSGDVETSPKTDIYGLGAILYELLIGRPPFERKSLAAVIRAVEFDEPVHPRKLEPRVPQDLQAICLKCLHKNPDRRYATATDVSADLERFVRGEPVHARTAGFAEKVAKWTRRHPLAAILLATLVVSVVGITWLWYRAETLRISAVKQATIAHDARRAERQERLRLERVLYAHDVSLANYAYLANYADRAGALLDACPTHLRNWEWRYLKQICHQEIRSFNDLPGLARSVAMSGDGKLVAAATGMWGVNQPGIIKIWDVETGAVLKTLAGHRSSIMDLAISPDGKFIASAGVSWHSFPPPSGALVWSIDSGEVVWSKPDINAFSLAFSPDGKHLAIGASNGNVSIHETDSGQTVHDIHAHTGIVLGLAYSPDGKIWASGGRDGTLSIRESESGIELAKFKGLRDVRRVCFSPTGNELAIALFSGQIKLYRLRGDEVREKYSFQLNQRANSLQFTPDGQYLVTSILNEGIKFVDPKTAKVVRELHGHNGEIPAIAMSRDGQLLASAGQNGNVKVWDLTQPERFRARATRGPFNVDIQDALDGRNVVLAMGFNSASGVPSIDHTLKLWNVAAGRETKVFKGHTTWLTSADVDPKGRWLVSADHDGNALLWDVRTGDLVHKMEGHRGAVADVAFGDQGRVIYTCGWDKALRAWDSESGKPIRRWIADQAATTLACPTGNSYVAAARRDGVIEIWKLDSEAPIARCGGESGVVHHLAFNPTGDLLAAANEGGSIEIWKLSDILQDQSPRPAIVCRGHTEPVLSIGFSKDGLRMVSASSDRSNKVWDVESGEEVLSLSTESGLLPKVIFGPDDQTITQVNGNLISTWNSAERLIAKDEADEASRRHQLEWHERELQRAQSDQNPFAIAFHARALLDFDTDHAALRTQCSLANAQMGRIQEAISDLETILENGANLNAKTTLAFLYLASGDRESYREMCRQLLADYRPGQDESAANSLAWMCVLSPEGVREHPQLIAMAEQGVNRKAFHELNTLGAVYCRAGQFDKAIEMLNRSIEMRDNTGYPYDWLFLALAQLGLGHKEEAARQLQRARDWKAEQMELEDANEPVDPLFNWRNRLELDILIPEVEAALAK